MRTWGAAIAVAVLVATSACSGGSSRPSQSEVSSALQKTGDSKLLGSTGASVSKKAADCLAKVLVESDISDRALRAIVDGKKDYTPSAKDRSAAGAVGPQIVACLPAGLGN